MELWALVPGILSDLHLLKIPTLVCTKCCVHENDSTISRSITAERNEYCGAKTDGGVGQMVSNSGM